MKKHLLHWMMLLMAFTVPWVAQGQVSIPYNEGFENMSSAGDLTAADWIMYKSDNSSFLAIETSASNVHGGSKALNIDSYDASSSSAYVIVGLPVVNADINGLQITFSYKVSTGSVYIGYLTDASDASTFVSLQSFNSSSSYSTKTVELSNAPASAARIAIKYSHYYRCYIDDIEVKALPTCYPPTNLVVMPATNTATFSWTAFESAVSYEYLYTQAGETPSWDNANSTRETSVTLERLTPATSYVAYVRSNCGDEVSDVASIPFATACEAITEYPYSENFDNLTVSSNYTAPSARILPNCWSAINTTTYTSYQPFPSAFYYSYTDYSNSSPNCLKLYSYYSSYSDYDPQDQYAILPQMENLAGKQITLQAKGYNTSSTFWIGTMSDPTDTSTFAPITSAAQALTTAYQEFTFSIPRDVVANYVAIKIQAATSSRTYNAAYIDDIVIDNPPSCVKPTELAVTANGQEATVTWTSDASQWQVAHATSADADPNENIVGTVSEASYSARELALDVDHYFWVRTYCSESEQSQWTSPVSVHIGYCVPAPTSVDGSGIKAVSFGSGEGTTVNNSGTKLPATSPYYGNYSAMIGAVPAGTTADVDITFGTNYTYGIVIWVDWNSNLTFEDSEVVYKGEAAKASTITHTASFDIPANQTLGDYRMRIGAADSYFDSYVGGSASAAHDPCYSGGYTVFHDYTLRVLKTPTCYKPTATEAVNITASGATIQWTPDSRNAEGATYSILDSEDQVVRGAESISGNSFDLTNLSDNTEYTFKVRTNCAADDETVEVVAVTFSTLANCPKPVLAATGITNITGHAAQVAWTGYEANSSYVVNYREAAYFDGITEQFNTSSIPTTWNQYSGLVDNVIAGTATLSTASSWGTNSYALGAYNAKLNIYGTSCKSWLVTPEMTLPANGVLNFDLAFTAYNSANAASGDCSDDRLVVLVYANNAWTILREWNNSGSTYVFDNIATAGENVNIDLSAYAGQTVKVAFYGESTESGGDNDMHIDNVSIGVNVAAKDWQSVNVTNTTTTLRGLNPETAYDVQVVGQCAGDATNESDIVSFTTTVACPAPTTLAAGEITTNSITLTWTNNNGEGARYIIMDGEGVEIPATQLSNLTETGVTITGLTANTAYSFKVKADCSAAEDGYSEVASINNLRTACAAISDLTEPYTCGFEADELQGTSSTQAMPWCWTRYNDATSTSYNYYPYSSSSSTYSRTGSRTLQFTSNTYASAAETQIAVLPQIAVRELPLSSLRLRFYARGGSSNGGTISVGTMSDPADTSTFTEVQAIEIASGSAYPTDPYTVSGFADNGDQYIAIMMVQGSATQYVYIDDLTLDLMPSCMEVTSLSVDEITTTGATIHWVIPEGQHATYSVYNGTELLGTTAEVDLTSLAVTGLMPSTIYTTLKVVANCGGSESPAVAVPSFTTACEAISTLPYEENFNTYSGSATSTSAPSDYPSHTMPLCWDFLNMSATTGAYPQAFLTSSSSYSASGNSLFFKSSSSTPIYAILPAVARNLSGMQLQLTYRNEGTSTSNGIVSVGYMTDITDASTYVNVESFDRTTTLTSKLVLFNGSIPDGARAVVRYEGSSNNYYASIDNIVLAPQPTCYKPTAVTAENITKSGATISWTRDMRNAEGETYAILDGEGQVVAGAENISDTSFVLTGLTQHTTYTYMVRTNCAAADESVDNVAVTFTTAYACPAPTALAAGTPTPNSVSLSWTAGGEEAAWQLCVNGDEENLIAVTTNPYTLEGLTPDSTYTVKLRANCGDEDGVSLWSDVVEFTTAAACPIPVLAEEGITNIYAHQADVAWTGFAENNSYVVNYRVAAGVRALLTEDFEDATAYSNNWTVVNYSSANSSKIGRETSAAYADNYGFRFSSYSNASTYEEHLINNNELTAVTDGTFIEFYYKKSNSSAESFMVGYSSTDNEPASFTFGENIEATQTWQLFHDSVPTGTKYISIKYTTTGCNYYLYIDDIIIGKNVPAGEWQTVEATDTTTTLTGLAAETTYEVKVAGKCAGDAVSGACEAVTFTTGIPCPAPTTLTLAGEPTFDGVALSWTENGLATAWQISINGDEENLVAATTNPYTLEGLTDGMEYTVKVRANCGDDDGVSEWSNAVKFATVARCPVPTDLVMGEPTAHGVTFSWTAGGTETNWTVTIGENEPVTVSGEPTYTATGLNANTTYAVRIVADCGGENGSSHTALEGSFLTACEAITAFPWTENFEGYEAGYLDDHCWLNEHISGSGNKLFTIYTSTNASNSTHQLQLPDQTNGTMTKLRLPEMTFTADQYQFMLDVYRTSYSSTKTDEGVRVFISEDGEIEGATELAFIPRVYSVSNDVIPAESVAGWYTYKLTFSVTGNHYIIMRGESKYGNSTNMDNFVVRETPKYTVTTAVTMDGETPMGEVSTTPASLVDLYDGTEVSVSATAAYGYQFVNWTEGEDVAVANNPYTFTLNADRNLTANFAFDTFTITGVSNYDTMGTVSGTASVPYKTEVTLTAEPNSTCYEFVNWTLGDEVLGTEPTVTVAAMNNTVVVANFQLKQYTGVATVEVCDSYEWNGVVYTETPAEAPTYIYKTAEDACDSTVTLLLTVNHPMHEVFAETVCESYNWKDGDGQDYTESGVYTYLHADSNGCEQVDTLHLTVNFPTHDSFTETVCEGYEWNDSIYTASGLYTYTHADANGCAQVDTLHLTVNYSSTGADTITACDSYEWINGTNYTVSNNEAQYTLTNAVGCDSVVTLNLTINYSNAALDIQTVCDSLIWHGTTYTESTNVPTFVCPNAVGCDSTTTLNLIVNYSNTGVETVTACDSYVWHDVTYTASNTTATFTEKNAANCDSVVTLNLTVNYSNTGVETVTACDSYVWHDVTYTASNNTATFTEKNAAGCDSVVTLNLTVNYSNTGVETVTACDSYVWHDVTYTASNNTATFTEKNAAGCDSVVTLNLTVNYSNTGVETVTACDSYVWHDVTYTASNNTATFTEKNAAGCDSVVTLNLTVNYSNTGVETVTACDSYVWHDVTYTASNTTATFTEKNAAGCDSVVTLNLTINASTTSTTDIAACNSYAWNGTVYTESGAYTYSTTNAAGCDSTATLNLTVNVSTSSENEVTACNSYIWNNTEYTESGDYVFNTTNAAECDSTATLHLTINHCGTTTLTACESYIWTLNNQTYTESGVYVSGTDTLILTINNPVHVAFIETACDSYVWNDSAYFASGDYTFAHVDDNGCNQVDTLHLTINVSSTSTTDITACNSYAWNGTVYTESGAYTYTTENVAGCDSTATLNLTINASTTSTTDIAACDSYEWNDSIYTESGVYTFETENAAGCDSIATLNLTVNNSSKGTETVTACNSYAWNGTVYTESGVYNYSTENAAGCDSTATLNLTINVSSTSTTDIAACNSYEWNGTVYTESGAYTYTTENAAGCDSTATLHLTINASTTSTTDIAACDSYEWNVSIYTESGVYTFETENAAGCDSTATLNLTINASTTSTTDIAACDSYEWNDSIYTESGVYTFETENAAGCDSTATLNLTINASTTSTTDIAACDSYEWNDSIYTESGVYTFETENAAGCDSTATLNLTINASTTSTTDIAACDSYEWNDSIYTESGVYTFETENAAGCDSIATLNLTINVSSTSTTDITACNSYEWNGTVYTESGAYTYTTENAAGCDSTATLNLTINASTTSTTDIAACDSYEWNDSIYTESGVYTFETENAAGCDSTATLNLTINASTTSTTDIAACNSYEWNGTVYTESGAYTYTTENAAGCDSTATLNLTINASTTSTTDIAACDSYEWNDSIYTESGVYTFETENAAGCDSTATLNLTINVSSTSTTDITACNSYEWNDSIYTESGVYTFETENAAGCDSIATLNLTINVSSTSTTDITACDSYEWNDSIYTESGVYTFETENAAGCDSTATLALTINNAVPQTITEVACESYTWNDSVYTASGDYTYSHADVNNCIQVDTLHLTIGHKEHSYTELTNCGPYTWELTGLTYNKSGMKFNKGTTAEGCPIRDTLVLTVVERWGSYTKVANCGPYTWDKTGQTYNKSGLKFFKDTADDGCPIRDTLELTIVERWGRYTEATSCGPYTWEKTGQTYNNGGLKFSKDTADDGCEIRDTLNLIIVEVGGGSNVFVKNCGPYTWDVTGQTYNKSGEKIYTTVDPVDGCFHRDTLTLTIVDRWGSYTELSYCGPYTWEKTGQTYNKSGLKFYKDTAEDGCPIRDTLNLKIENRFHSYTEVANCGPYTWDLTGQTYNKSGMKFRKDTAENGCLIRDTLVLTVVDRWSSYTKVANCGPYTWDKTGQTYNKSGLKFYKSVAEDGCPIRDTLELTVVTKWSSHDTVVSCDGPYTWDKTGQTYKKTGMKFFKGTAADGCPIRDTLYVIIGQSEHSYAEVTSYGPYTWDLTGKTYNKSGLKFNKTTNADGCPVRDTLMLTVLEPNAGAESYEYEIAEAETPIEAPETIEAAQLSTLNSVKVYPNPTSGRVQINVTEAEKVEVLDLVGRLVAVYENTNTLDLTNLADGTYTLRITLAEGVALRKVVKR